MFIFNVLFSFSFSQTSTSHRSEKSELSIGEEIEEDLSVEVDDLNTSDKVRCGRRPCSSRLCLWPRLTVELNGSSEGQCKVVT